MHVHGRKMADLIMPVLRESSHNFGRQPANQAESVSTCGSSKNQVNYPRRSIRSAEAFDLQSSHCLVGHDWMYWLWCADSSKHLHIELPVRNQSWFLTTGRQWAKVDNCKDSMTFSKFLEGFPPLPRYYRPCRDSTKQSVDATTESLRSSQGAAQADAELFQYSFAPVFWKVSHCPRHIHCISHANLHLDTH